MAIYIWLKTIVTLFKMRGIVIPIAQLSQQQKDATILTMQETILKLYVIFLLIALKKRDANAIFFKHISITFISACS